MAITWKNQRIFFSLNVYDYDIIKCQNLREEFSLLFHYVKLKIYTTNKIVYLPKNSLTKSPRINNIYIIFTRLLSIKDIKYTENIFIVFNYLNITL